MSNNRRDFIKQTALLGFSGLSSNRTMIPETGGTIKLPNKAIFLFQGDSITDGNRGRNNDLNHIMGHGYAYSIASRIGTDFPDASYQFINRGISGNTVPDLLKRWKEDTIDLRPQVLSLLVGINDVNAEVNGFMGHQNFEEFKLGYRSLLDQAMFQNPNLILVLCLPFVTRGSRTSGNLELFEKLLKERIEFIRTIANEYPAIVVDFPKMFEIAFKKQSIDYWIWDGVHPTVFGHELMAREWMKALSQKLRFLRKYHY